MGCYVTKFVPHRALTLIARGTLTFDERVVLYHHPSQSTDLRTRPLFTERRVSGTLSGKASGRYSLSPCPPPPPWLVQREVLNERTSRREDNEEDDDDEEDDAEEEEGGQGGDAEGEGGGDGGVALRAGRVHSSYPDHSGNQPPYPESTYPEDVRAERGGCVARPLYIPRPRHPI